MNRQQSYVGLQQKQYVKAILQVLKTVAFHELYMEKFREQLANNEFYDPLTAFKSIDSFKHNKIVSYEIYSFLELHGYSCKARQCEAVVTALNKNLASLTYDDFLQMTLPSDINLRNISLNRCSGLKIEVGTMIKVNNIKNISASKAAAFLWKEVEFGRHLLYCKQEFCQRYGGDLYTFNQLLFKGKKNLIKFDEFYEICRKYNYFFNQTEFRALWVRTKSYSLETSLKRLDKDPEIVLEALPHLLLTNNLDTKQMIGLRACEDQSAFQNIVPSYKSSVREREENKMLEEEMEKRKKIETRSHKWSKDFNYSYYYPEQQLFPSKQHFNLREKEKKWEDEVKKMSEEEINIRYMQKRRPSHF